MARKDPILSYQHSRGSTQVNRIDSLPNFGEKTYIICDEFFRASLSADYYIIANEENKSLQMFSKISADMLELGVARDWTLVTIGGGVIGDLGGYIASSYMRGIRWINIPTTLLAQVDSCIGGKTGLNLPEGKNLIGAIYQPSEVLLCSSFLSTLSRIQLQSGWGEILKYSFIDIDFIIKDRLNQIPSDQMIDLCLKTKSRFVEVDEFDNKGSRVLLNYGHTIAHGIEKVSGYEVSHGEAVAWGILFEQFLSSKKIHDFYHEYEPMSHKLVANLTAEKLVPYLKKDKKGSLVFFNEDLRLIQLTELEFSNSWKEFTSILKSC